MVKGLSPSEKQSVAAAIAEAEHAVGVEVVLVIAPISDPYQSYVLLYGLFCGCAASAALWMAGIASNFPVLLMTQLGVITLFSIIPWLHSLCIRLIPMHVKQRRSAKRAYEEYCRVTHYIPASTPVLLIYVSLAERYVHILPSREVKDKTGAGAWQQAVKELTNSIRINGLANACKAAISHSTRLLAPHFPARLTAHNAIPDLIEINH